MNGRIERMTPREDFLIAMFNDDPRLVEALREMKPWYKRINWGPVYGGVIVICGSMLCWTLLIYSILYVKGWLR
jgi:hypothetical protein